MREPVFQFEAISEQELASRVIPLIGYPSAGVVGAEVFSQIQQAVALGTGLARPAWRYRIDPLIACETNAFRGPELRVESVKWARLVAKLPEPGVLLSFVVTMGSPIDERIARDQEDSLFAAYLLDAVGSTLVEALADRFTQYMVRMLRERGLHATDRFSPGYCDWGLAQGQEQIFRVLKPEAIGVRCTDSGLMLPRKSISACMVGARQVPVPFPCDACACTDCDHRRGRDIPGEPEAARDDSERGDAVCVCSAESKTATAFRKGA